MDSASGPDRLRRSGVLLTSLGILLSLWFVSDGAHLVASLVEGRWIPEAARYLAIHRSLDPDVRTAAFYVEHGQPVLLRLSAALIVLGSVLSLAAAKLDRAVRAFFAEETDPRNLALVRVTVFGAMFWWWLNNDLTSFAALPPELIVPPPGLGWAASLLPRDPGLVNALSIGFAVASIMAMIGFRTSLSAWTAVALGLLALGLPQFYGKIDHYHHFLWFGMLLAASPSGDAWSVDAWRRRRSGVEPASRGAAYAYPIRTVMLLIGCFYFFAGFWKVVIGGPAWAGETMRTILHAQWMRIDQVPAFRVDEWGAWTSLGGLAVIAFELLFVFFILSPRTRKWAAVAGVVFHLTVWITTGINFWTLLVCYTVFIDEFNVLRAAEGLRSTLPSAPPSPAMRRLSFSLVLIAALAGVSLVDSWPIAVYPTFAGMAEPHAWTVTMEGRTREGQSVRLRPWRSSTLRARYGNSRVGGLVSQVAWAQDPEHRSRKAVALAAVAAAHEPSLAGVAELQVYRELVAVDPSRWEDAPIRREHLGTWRAAGG